MVVDRFTVTNMESRAEKRLTYQNVFVPQTGSGLYQRRLLPGSIVVLGREWGLLSVSLVG